MTENETSRPKDTPGAVPVDGAVLIDDAVGAEHVGGPSGNTARNLSMVVGVVVVALIGLLAFGSATSDRPSSRLLGQRVPAISGVTLDGGHYDIDAAGGRWVLVNFFATWCPGCIVEHPELVRLEEWGEATGQIEVVSIVFDDSPSQVAALFDRLGGTWPVLDDPTLAVAFQIAQVPESFLVDPNGIVVVHATGGIEADPIIDAIEGLGTS